MWEIRVNKEQDTIRNNKMDIKKSAVFTPCPLINLICFLILSFHLHLGLGSGLFPPPKTVTFKNSNEIGDSMYLLTYLLTYLLHGAESFLRS